MRLCLTCGAKRYNKSRRTCDCCGSAMRQVDGRLRKVVESLTKSEFLVAFATCETYTRSEICTAEILIGFCEPHDKFVASGLPEHFMFVSDRYGNQNPYSLNYVLNHLGRPMSMIVFDYCGHPAKHPPAEDELKKAIGELYKWAMDIENNKWFVYKLGGYL